MKKILFVATMVAFAMASCNGGSKETTSTTKDSGETAAAQASTNIAWVEYDSLMNNYDLYKYYNKVMEKKAAEVQSTLEQKGRELQSLMQSTQQKYENGGFSTKTELESAQKRIENKQNELAQMEYEMKANLANETARITQEARDSIMAFIDSYNKEKKFDYIMFKGGDNMLYANPALDITDDVIKGLNKRYTGKVDADEEEKED